MKKVFLVFLVSLINLSSVSASYYQDQEVRKNTIKVFHQAKRRWRVSYNQCIPFLVDYYSAEGLSIDESNKKTVAELKAEILNVDYKSAETELAARETKMQIRCSLRYGIRFMQEYPEFRDEDY